MSYVFFFTIRRGKGTNTLLGCIRLRQEKNGLDDVSCGCYGGGGDVDDYDGVVFCPDKETEYSFAENAITLMMK